MFEKLLEYYYHFFIDNENRTLLIKSYVCIEVMEGRYNHWLKLNEITPIEDLPGDKKQKYWDVAIMYHEGKEKRISAAKAYYALELMTGLKQ